MKRTCKTCAAHDDIGLLRASRDVLTVKEAIEAKQELEDKL